MDLMQLFFMVISAVVFAVSGYLKSVGEKPDPVKLTATLILGAAIGLVFSFMGAPITEEAVWAILLTYIGALVLIENGIKAVIRRWQARKADREPSD